MHHMRLQKYIRIALIVLLGLIAYGNSLHNRFAFDDYSVIEVNPQIANLSAIGDLFNHDYFEMSGEKSYRPLVTLTYIIDAVIWKLNPFGYHLTNLLFHLGSAVILLYLGILLTGSATASLIAALLFVCHPLMTESVCSITFREDIMCGLFLWLALFGYIHYRKTDNPALIGVALASYFLSILSKEMGLAFVPIIVVFELFYRKKPKSAGIFVLTGGGIALVTVLFLLLRFVWMRNPQDYYTAPPFSIATLIKTLLVYVQLYWFPIRLRTIYYSEYLFIHWREVVLCVLAVTGTAAGVWSLRAPYRKRAFLLLAATLVSLVPVLNIYPIRHPIAERYTYVPAFGFLLVMGLIVCAVMYRSSRRAGLVILVGCLVLFTGRTIARNSVWLDNFSLWLSTTRQNPWAVEAQYSLGHAYQMRGMTNEAIRAYKRALRLNPDYFDAHVNLGRAYLDLDLPRKAIEEFMIAARIDPDKPIVYYNLGVAYTKLSDDRSAINNYMRAIQLEPQYVDAYNSLGGIFARLGDTERARTYWHEAVRVDPTFAQGYANLGSLYANIGDKEKARYYWYKALQIDPDYEKVKQDLRRLEQTRGQ